MRDFFLFYLLLVSSHLSLSQDSEFAIVDTTNCFLIMQVELYGNSDMTFYHGDGTINYYRPWRERNGQVQYPPVTLRHVSEVTDALYLQGWRLIDAAQDAPNPNDLTVRRYYYFERPACTG